MWSKLNSRGWEQCPLGSLGDLLRSRAFIMINFLSLDTNTEVLNVLNRKHWHGRMEK